MKVTLINMKLIFSFIFLCLWYGVTARCAYRGVCYEIGGHKKPCAVDEEPKPLLYGLSREDREEIMSLLERRCPHMIYDDEGNTIPDEELLACCEPNDIRSFSASLLMSDGVLGRCPTCARNFARQICEMNCSPEQSRFVTTQNATGSNGEVYVTEIEYRMYEDFMVGAHGSCSGVVVPQTGLPAINMMCGNAAVCDPESWFGFTGDAQNNPFAPVQVNFVRSLSMEDSMHAPAPPCNYTAAGDLPCSCIDCLATCPVGNEPVLPDICTVLSVNCIGFSVGIIFFVIFVAVFVFLTTREYKKNKKPNPTITKKRRKENKIIKFFQFTFAQIGSFAANNPILVLMVTSWISFGMLFGVLNLNLTTNPIELWSAPESRSRQHLNYFNTRFGPFYRAAQVYLRMEGLEPFVVDNVTYGPAFRIEAVRELIKLEDAILAIGRDNGGVTLEQVCYAPLRPQGSEQLLDQCVSMSVASYFGEDRNDINNNTYLNQMQNCLNNYLSFACMAPWGGGADPELAFGGFEGSNILTADTLLINFPITNFLLEEDLRPVLEWEQKFLDLMHDYEANWKADFVDVSFAAERSVEDEIQRVSVAEAVPIAISYIIMFIYVTIALGNVRNCKTLLIDSKVVVAIGSILVVLIAIFCSIGVMGFAKITVTLLAVNVIPFFVLSVGVDNVFLMVNTIHDIEVNLKCYDDYNENFSFDEKRSFVFYKMMEKVGPSMFVSSVTQITCFGIGSLANFPAVVSFAIFVSIALGFLFVFQITTVVAILSLDYKRSSQNRVDVFCCIQKKVINDDDPINSEVPYESVITKLMEPYAEFLLKSWVKMAVIVIFILILSISVIYIPQIEVGLDQEMALPADSYVYKYLIAVRDLLRIGPPVYFVLKSGLNFTNPDHQNVICGSQLCHEDSLATQIFLASRFTNVTYIARSSNSWLDDFFDWSSLYGACCQYNTTDDSFCQSTDNSGDCAYCSIERDEWKNGLRPAGEAFERYIPFFLRDTPTEICNKGGLASYFNAVNYVLDSEGRATVHDTNFMAFHSSVSTSYDYISAVKYGYEISQNITDAIKTHTGLDIEVFPYSVFYVFFEQYLTMWRDTFVSISYCMLGAFVINLLASGFNLLTTFAVIFTAIMVVLNMMGIMYLWSIPLNAVSCVNLIVSIGIAVEFCSHIAYAFARSEYSGDKRIIDALKTVGSTIITGITFTNLPIIVLAFSYTQIIEVFFFRMFFSLVILGFVHGMIFFPVFLSYLNNLKSE